MAAEWLRTLLAWKPATQKSAKRCEELFGEPIAPNLADVGSVESLRLAGAVYRELGVTRRTSLSLVDADGGAGSASGAALEKGIFRREELMSTGIGLGCAVPHVRLLSVSKPVMAVGIYRSGVKDYESLDDSLVRLVFMVAAGAGQHEQHLRLLATITKLMKNQELVNALCQPETPQQAFDLLCANGKG